MSVLVAGAATVTACVGGRSAAPSTIAPSTIAPSTIAPSTIASPTIAPATIAPVVDAPCASPSSGCRTIAGVDGLPPHGSVLAATGSWAPRPEVGPDELQRVATADATGVALHTSGGDRRFLPGVNLGGTVPGRQPGEITALEAADYERWFDVAGRLGARVIRVYTIHPPAFYDQLASYNETHPDEPLYLVQGVYLLDEQVANESGDLWAPVVDEGFSREVSDAHLAVSGRLNRPDPIPGRAHGSWTTDVGAWVAGWIIGVELDPVAVAANDDTHADRPRQEGRFVSATAGATPTERWYAEHLDALAGFEESVGRSVPLAFVNWPTTDPLDHPDEPLETEDLVGIDANNVLATDRWPGGMFASYHAYPYYPDFQRHEPGLQVPGPDGRIDPYRAYVRALNDHHARAGIPVIVSEVGVPSSLGSAHRGPLGRDQGGHDESTALDIDAELVEIIAEEGLAGAFLFALVDEWFKFTWNTVDLQIPADRRSLWLDPLTNEQAFGLVAVDGGLADVLLLGDDVTWSSPPAQPNGDGGLGLTVAHDEAHLYLRIDGDGDRALTHVGLDVDERLGAGGLPGTDGLVPSADIAVSFDAEGARLDVMTAREHVAVMYPDAVGGVDVADLADGAGSWTPFRQIVNRALTIPTTGVQLDAEIEDADRLVEATTIVGHDRFDARAAYWRDGDVIMLRLPWAMLGFADPSLKQVLDLTTGEPRARPTEGVVVSAVDASGGITEVTYRWDEWNVPVWHERVKDGASDLASRLIALG